MEKEKESSRLSWPWKKKSSNKAAAAAVTSLASAGGVGGASPNLASLFQDNNQQVQTPPFVPPPPLSLSLCAALVLSQTSSAMVSQWVIAIPQLCKPGARTATILIQNMLGPS